MAMVRSVTSRSLHPIQLTIWRSSAIGWPKMREVMAVVARVSGQTAIPAKSGATERWARDANTFGEQTVHREPYATSIVLIRLPRRSQRNLVCAHGISRAIVTMTIRATLNAHEHRICAWTKREMEKRSSYENAPREYALINKKLGETKIRSKVQNR